MDKSEIYAFITKNPVNFLATTDGSIPHVRGMDTFRADENGLILYTGKQKDVFRQISANPAVELCYWADGKQIRVSGRMEVTEDLDLKKEIVEARPFLKPAVEAAGNYDGIAVCRLKNGKATVFTMQEMNAPKTYIDL